jgi:hypothetical protein
MPEVLLQTAAVALRQRVGEAWQIDEKRQASGRPTDQLFLGVGGEYGGGALFQLRHAHIRLVAMICICIVV